MEPFPLKTNQEALGAEGFLGLAVPCSQSVWRSLVSLPLCASAACASPGHELLSPTGWCLMALSWQGKHQKLLAAPAGGKCCLVPTLLPGHSRL